MKTIDYSLIDLRIHNIKDKEIIELVYDDKETYYYRITFLVSRATNYIIINTNIDLVENDDSYFDAATNDVYENQFIGVAKVVFINLVIKEYFDDQDFQIETNYLMMDDILKSRFEYIKTLDSLGDSELSEQLIEEVISITLAIDANFLTGEVLEDLISNVDFDKTIN